MKTYCKAEMKFTDITALSDASVTTEDNQLIGSLDVFKDETRQKDYGTLELNQYILDGTKCILQENPIDIAFWNNQMSKEDCTFDKNPKIEISFAEKHSSAAITLYFADEYPAEIKITWYTLYGSVIDTKTYYPDGLIYVCDKQADNYGKVTIEFIRTSYPKRYVKLQYILYGKYIAWFSDMIKSAEIQEDMDFTSATLPINEATISIVDEKNDFDSGNENGAWKSIQKTQEITLTEYKDGTDIPMGTFYMDDFSFSDNEAKFSLIDTIGLLDKYTFYEGQIYVNEKASNIIKSIFEVAGIKKYIIDEEIGEILLSGYMGIQSCRQALQRVCFACKAVADDSRSDTIRIYKPDRYVKSVVGLDRKINGGTKVCLDKYISGVVIECTGYSIEDKVSEIFKGVLPKGESKIIFSNPYLPSSVSSSSGTVIEKKTNYLILRMDAAGECVISGKKYVGTKFSYQANVDHIDSGETENIKKFSGCTVYNTDLLKSLAEHLLKYYSLRKKVDMEYFVESEKIGNWININQIGGTTSTSFIESQTIDLAGGYISTAKCRGYSIVTTDIYYTGEELYSGGDVII